MAVEYFFISLIIAVTVLNREYVFDATKLDHIFVPCLKRQKKVFYVSYVSVPLLIHVSIFTR